MHAAGAFQTAAFVLGLRVSLRVSLSDWNLNSLELLGLLDICPIDFQSQIDFQFQVFGGLIPLLHHLGVSIPDVWLTDLASQQ